MDITSRDWACWLKQIVVSAIDRGYGELSREQFEDVTLEMLDHDPKLEVSNETQKQQIVDRLWDQWVADPV